MKISKSRLKQILKEELEAMASTDADYDPFEELGDISVESNMNEALGMVTIPLIAAAVLAGGAGFLAYVKKKRAEALAEVEELADSNLILLKEAIVTDPILLMHAKKVAELTIILDMSKGLRSAELQEMREEHKNRSNDLRSGVQSAIDKFNSDIETKYTVAAAGRRNDLDALQRETQRALRASGEEVLDLGQILIEIERLEREATGKRTKTSKKARKAFDARIEDEPPIPQAPRAAADPVDMRQRMRQRNTQKG